MDLAYMAALPQEEFTERRQKVLAQMQPNSALLLFSEIEKRRNNDCDFPFRQDSYFWYLTGFNEPNAALLLIKTEDAEKAVDLLKTSGAAYQDVYTLTVHGADRTAVKMSGK